MRRLCSVNSARCTVRFSSVRRRTRVWRRGVDRMIMLLREEENIREVIAFPMSGTAQDLMCGAPGDVTEKQLREAHIKVRA